MNIVSRILPLLVFTCAFSTSLSLALTPQSFILTPSSSSLTLSHDRTGIPLAGIFQDLALYRNPTDGILDDPSFVPTKVTLEDDVFHNSNALQYTEWWYFDAEFSNQYTMQFSVHVYNILTMSFISVNYNVYHFGTPISEYRTFYPLAAASLSSDTPYISIENDTLLMVGLLGPYHDKLYYHIIYRIDNSSMDLWFDGLLTDGWKGTTTAGDWAVMLPKASVAGTMMVENKRLTVNGVGYHDHNWNVTLSSGLNYGWIWGKTHTDTLTLVWSEILPTWFSGNPLLVVNKEFDGFYAFPSEQLAFSITKLSFRNGMIVPYGFTLQGETDQIKINLSISIIDTQYTSVLGIINYWRYHIHSQGSILFYHNLEIINNYDVAEFIRFRFY